MTLFIAGLVIFLGVHSVSIVNAPWRDKTAARIGAAAWQGLYSVVAIAGFVLIVYGYGLARQQTAVLYVPPVWMHYLALVLLVFVFPMLFATYLPGRIKSHICGICANMLWKSKKLSTVFHTQNLSRIRQFDTQSNDCF